MDSVVNSLVGLLQLALIVGIILLVRRARRPTIWREVPDPAQLVHDIDGAIIVPVRRLQNIGFLRQSRNDLTPKLWITSAGLRIKVFRLTERPFSDFKRIDARKTAFGDGVRLIFFGQGLNEAVIATVGDASTARAVLRALPANNVLTPSARILCDGLSPPLETTPAETTPAEIPPAPRLASERATTSPVDDIRPPAGRPLLAGFLLCLGLLFAGYMIWGTIDYSGLYRWLADKQIAAFGQYWAGMTTVIPIILISCPVLVLAAAISGTGKGGMGCLWMIGLVGVSLLATGAGLIIHARGLPTLDDPLIVIDLAKSGDAAPPAAHVQLIGRAQKAHVLSLKWRGKTSWHEHRYTPIMSANGPDAPVRFVTSRSYLDPQGPVVGADDDPQGLMRPDALPNEARVGFERAGVILAQNVHVLDQSDDQRFDSWAMAIGCLLAGAASLGLLAMARRSPSNAGPR